MDALLDSSATDGDEGGDGDADRHANLDAAARGAPVAASGWSPYVIDINSRQYRMRAALTQALRTADIDASASGMAEAFCHSDTGLDSQRPRPIRPLTRSRLTDAEAALL